MRALRNPQLREQHLIVKAGTLVFMHHDCVHRACRSEEGAPFRAMIAIRNCVRVSDPIAIPGKIDHPGPVDWPAGPANAQHTALWRYLQGLCAQPWYNELGHHRVCDSDLRAAVCQGESEGLDVAFQMAAAAAQGDKTAADELVIAATGSADEAMRRVASYALTAAGTSDATSGQYVVTRLIGILERGAEVLEVPPCEHSDHIDRKMNVLVMVVHAIGQLADCMPPATTKQAVRAVAAAMQRATAEIEQREHTLPEETRLLCVDNGGKRTRDSAAVVHVLVLVQPTPLDLQVGH